jgi:agmatinase
VRKTGRKVFFDLPQEAANPEDAAVLILPVPYDATASWLKGSASAPEAILEASQHVELWDIETASEPWRSGIAALEPVDFDGLPEDLASEVGDRVRKILSEERFSQTVVFRSSSGASTR